MTAETRMNIQLKFVFFQIKIGMNIVYKTTVQYEMYKITQPVLTLTDMLIPKLKMLVTLPDIAYSQIKNGSKEIQIL